MGVRLVAMVMAGLLGTLPALAAESAEPAKPKVTVPASPSKRGDPNAAECGWIGKRIIQLLSRDDVVAAGEFRQFYVGFGCSEAHLGAAFGCAIDGGNPGAADSCSARSECIDLCWASPTASSLDKSAPTPVPANGKPQAPAPQPPKKPAEKPADKPADKPAEKPAAAPAPAPADKVLAPRGPYDKQ